MHNMFLTMKNLETLDLYFKDKLELNFYHQSKNRYVN